MTGFPRKVDNTLDFLAYYRLNKQQRQEAEVDLKQNGSPEDTRQMEQFKRFSQQETEKNQTKQDAIARQEEAPQKHGLGKNKKGKGGCNIM